VEGKSWLKTTWRFGLLRCDIHRLTPVNDACGNSLNFVRFIAARTIRNWAELLPKIEEWLNTTVSGSTGFTPLELLFEEKKPDLFEAILKKSPENLPKEETIAVKVMKAFAKMTKKASDRRERKKGRKPVMGA
jgi:hypothetical protein